uniref:Uncharacterized protein n=1 Tax=Theileria annulata TaxID=5874 RepID=A0A3B0MFP7_THEAN
MELGGGFVSNLKAKNFLGFLNLRNGVLVISFTQILFGAGLYCTLHYLHPSLMGVAWFLLLLHFITGAIGLISTFTRNLFLYVLYLILFAFSLVVVSMVALDMAEIVHFFPKAPELHDFSLLGFTAPFVIRFKTPNASVLFPFNFFKLPNDTTGVLPQLPHYDEMVVTKFTMSHVDKHNHKHCNKRDSTRFDDDVSSVLDNLDNPDDLKDLRNALKQRLQDNNTNKNNNGVADNYNAYDNPDGNVSGSKDLNSTKPLTNGVSPAGDKSKESDSFYDHLPFMPHPGETEGESEEVSKDEFPPETNDLTPEGKSEVVVLYKLQKRCNQLILSYLLLIIYPIYS